MFELFTFIILCFCDTMFALDHNDVRDREDLSKGVDS